MRFLRYLKLNNYLNLKDAILEDLKDINIIIGPNNCGKTSLLRAINLLSRTEFRRVKKAFHCNICETVFDNDNNVQSARASLNEREKYLGDTKVKLTYGYYKDEIEKIVPRLSERQNGILTRIASDSKMEQHLKDEFSRERLLMSEQPKGSFLSQHISPIIWDEINTRIFGQIVFCPDERLQSYKEKNIPDYVSSKNLASTQERRIIEFLKEVVDPKMIDIRHSLDLIRDVEDQRFTTSIAEQGSGVKSLFCLMADILSERQTRILLIDEPELGLNPSGKHAFLKFLFEHSKYNQIFLATHDPTFVNPVLWNRENVSVYLFSLIDGPFVKVNLAQSKQDPNTFAGYLPHTTSLKKVHIYVEGKEDVYIFQIFLNKYLRSRFRYWYRYLNDVGIFHLAGDFWSHLLYTIPKRPYTSIVVLDGDKKKDAEQIINKYSIIEKDRFQIFNSLEELRSMSRRKESFSRPCPVYCLQRSKIEDYLEPGPSSKETGPLVADRMRKVPKEIEWIFDLTLQLAGINVQKHQLSED